MSIREYDKKLIFDASLREIDQNGHMHVLVANISAARVNPYYGKEIPGWKELGLDAGKIYNMLRDPQELKKAASTFNGSPLLDTHVPVSAWDHPFGKVVGATGTDAVFDGTYLKNSLVIWPAEAIENIESGEQKEISCSYSYTPDMSPGVFDGVAYDGIMRDIKANHVALVEKGRAGADVFVSDSQPVDIEDGMKKKYSVASIRKLAEDKKIDSLADLLKLLAVDEEAESEKKEEKAEDEETEEEKEARLKKESEEKAEDEEETEAEAKREKKDGEEKKAMDAAIKRAHQEARQEMRAVADAEKIVMPWVGEIVACDSAEDVFRAALNLKGIDTKGINGAPALKALALAHMQNDKKPVVAMDAKGIAGFYDDFPEAKNIKSKRG